MPTRELVLQLRFRRELIFSRGKNTPQKIPPFISPNRNYLSPLLNFPASQIYKNVEGCVLWIALRLQHPKVSGSTRPIRNLLEVVKNQLLNPQAWMTGITITNFKEVDSSHQMSTLAVLQEFNIPLLLFLLENLAMQGLIDLLYVKLLPIPNIKKSYDP